jgi:hypothetical protein
VPFFLATSTNSKYWTSLLNWCWKKKTIDPTNQLSRIALRLLQKIKQVSENSVWLLQWFFFYLHVASCKHCIVIASTMFTYVVLIKCRRVELIVCPSTTSNRNRFRRASSNNACTITLRSAIVIQQGFFEQTFVNSNRQRIEWAILKWSPQLWITRIT